MPLKTESWSTNGDFSFDVPDGVTCGWLTMIAAGYGGAPSDGTAIEPTWGGGGGSGECCFNQLVPLFSPSIPLHVGAGQVWGGTSGATMFGEYTVSAGTTAPDGPTFGQPGGGVNGGYDTSGFPAIGAYDSVRYFGGSAGGPIGNPGSGFGGVAVGADPGTGIAPGGGGAVQLFDGAGAGGNGDGVSAAPGGNATGNGAGGGGAGYDGMSVIPGGTGADGFVQITWLEP